MPACQDILGLYKISKTGNLKGYLSHETFALQVNELPVAYIILWWRLWWKSGFWHLRLELHIGYLWLRSRQLRINSDAISCYRCSPSINYYSSKSILLHPFTKIASYGMSDDKSICLWQTKSVYNLFVFCKLNAFTISLSFANNSFTVVVPSLQMFAYNPK